MKLYLKGKLSNKAKKLDLIKYFCHGLLKLRKKTRFIRQFMENEK